MRRAILGVLMAAACGASPAAPQTAGTRPRLVVLIVIDQLPSWGLERREGLARHGLRRILDEGMVYTRARYPYASTFTAPGHAALGSGAPPRVTGILANQWLRRDAEEVLDATDDPASPLVTGGRGGASPAALRVDGIADALRAATSAHGKSVGVAVKDRGAIFALGRHPTLALWFDRLAGRFTTSRWYAPALPAWAAALPPIAPRAGGAGVDLEEVMKQTPLSNVVTREAAEAAIAGERLGADDVPDYLVVSFSAFDYVGHRHGHESRLLDEMWRSIDVELGTLLGTLDARVGRGRWAVVLATDHGAARLVEETVARGGTARRIPWAELEAAAETAAASVAGPGDWIASAREPALYLGAAARALPAATRARLVAAAAQAMAAIDGIAYAWPTAEFGPEVDCATLAEPRRGACWSVDPERSGEIIYAPVAGTVIRGTWPDATTHGSPNPDDVTVPVVIVAPGLRPGRSDEPVSMLRVAPTLAALLGVPPPPAATEPPLVQPGRTSTPASSTATPPRSVLWISATPSVWRSSASSSSSEPSPATRAR